MYLFHFSELALSQQPRNLLLAALTAAKKMLVSRWVPPHSMTRRVWAYLCWTLLLWNYLQLVFMEQSQKR